MYDIKNLNIWKESSRNDTLFLSQCKYLEYSVSEYWERMRMREKEGKSVVNARYIPTLELLSIAVGFDRIKVEKGARVRYPIYMSKELMDEDLNGLDLTVRSSNCLHRYGYRTIGDLVNGIERAEDLMKIRNCGKTSIMEIMLTLMCYQFEMLDEKGQKKYIARMRELNM